MHNAKSSFTKNSIALALLGCTLATAPVYAQVKIVPRQGNITVITVDSNSVVDGEKLNITIAGSGSSCNYYLTITNTDTQLEWSFPKTSAFPAADKISFDLSDNQYAHGNYKLTAKAKSNDVRPGSPCEGGGNYVTFKKVRRALKLAADTPQIVDVNLQPGKKMGGINRYRTDEQISFDVVGNVENKDAKDAAKRCGWTALLIDGVGAKTVLGWGSQFGVTTQGAYLKSLATGKYTFVVHTTDANDSPPTVPCLGKITKPVEVFRVGGVITGVSLASFGASGSTSEDGILFISPHISGPQCMYTVTRKINGKNTTPTIHMHDANGDFKDFGGKMVGERFPDDQTEIEITIQGMGTNYFEGGSCEGSAKKSITVYDKAGKLGVVH